MIQIELAINCDKSYLIISSVCDSKACQRKQIYFIGLTLDKCMDTNDDNDGSSLVVCTR